MEDHTHSRTSPVLSEPTGQTRAQRYAHRLSLISAALSSTARFHWNKFAYNPRWLAADYTGILRENALDFYAGADDKGLIQGGNFQWQYFAKPFAQSDAKFRDKYGALRQALTKMPPNAALKFYADPHLEESNVIRAAFSDSGFKHINRPTYLYKPTTDNFDALIKEFKPDNRTKINRAAREIELTTMTVPDFIRFYVDYLEGRQATYNHYALNLDKEIFTKAIAGPKPSVAIIAARNKATPENPGPHPIDAAILHSCGADGYVKLLRVAYRVKKDNDPLPAPNQQAIKLLVTQIMLNAAKINATVDTDGFTAGGGKVYSRFGVFEKHDQDLFVRSTLYNMVQQIRNKVEPKLAKMLPKQKRVQLVHPLVFDAD